MSQYEPVYDVINPDPPTEQDKLIDETLFSYISAEIKLESDDEMRRRNEVLAEVRRVFQDWVKYIASEVICLPEEETQEAGGQLFVSGSHRLGVREPGADIDTVCVAPRFCSREHFFSSLKQKFQSNPDITNLVAIPSAAVPILSFDFRGVSIDLLFARLSENSVPENIDIFDDKILRNLDTASEKSLNGPRVTYMISRLVPSFENFLIVLRCIRRWAKRKGLYGNKLGYFGGVNLNILVAFVCQLYPKASPSSLLGKFFKVYSQWKWPNPIMLNRIQRVPPNDAIWSQEMYPYHLMPIITPAYPAMNSSISVSMHTRKVITTEIRRSYETIQAILRSHAGGNAGVSGGPIGWKDLFSPSDFFIRYDHYLCCHIIGTADDEASRSWIGFVESRIRKLPDYLAELPINPIHLYPVVFPTKKGNKSICYFIGFNVDAARMKDGDKSLYLDACVSDFRAELYRTIEEKEELSFLVEHFSWKQLPEEVFVTLGGKIEAKSLRQALKPKKATVVAAAQPTAEAPTTEKADSSDKATVEGGGVEGQTDQTGESSVLMPQSSEDVSEAKEDGGGSSLPSETVQSDSAVSRKRKLSDVEDISKAGASLSSVAEEKTTETKPWETVHLPLYLAPEPVYDYRYYKPLNVQWILLPDASGR